MLLATPFALTTIVAVPTTSGSLRNGTTIMPVPALVVAAAVFAPSGVKRPLSVVKVTMMPSGEGFPAELIKVAVIVVELVPSAISDVSPVASVMPPILTMAAPADGGVDGVVGWPEEVEGCPEVAASSFPLPTFSQPAEKPMQMRLTHTSSHRHTAHPP